MKNGKLAKKQTLNLKTMLGASAKTDLSFTKTNDAGGAKVTVNEDTGKVTAKKV